MLLPFFWMTSRMATPLVGFIQPEVAGSTGVESHNTMMAFADQIGNGQHLLSHDFSYSDNAILSFDMHSSCLFRLQWSVQCE